MLRHARRHYRTVVGISAFIVRGLAILRGITLKLTAPKSGRQNFPKYSKV